MPSIYVFKRKRKGKADKVYSAEIRFGEEHGGASYLRSTRVADRREAEAVARRIAREIEDKELPRRGVEIMTTAEMFSRWIDERGHELRSKKDIKWQIELILEHIGGAREVRDLGNKDIHKFVMAAKRDGSGAAVINRCLGRLRATMRYAAVKWEEPVRVISWKDMMQKEPKEREVYLSPQEARHLMAILPGHIGLAFAFSLYTGCRLNELETLVWERIDWERGAAMVITKAKGEEPVMRPLWLSAKAIAILRQVPCFWVDKSAEIGPVFNLINRRKHWEAARKEIGRPDVHWHDLRACTATWSRQFAGKDLRLIGKALGHSGTQVTERYARVTAPEIVEMLNQLPDISPSAPGQITLSNLLAKPESRRDAEEKTVKNQH